MFTDSESAFQDAVASGAVQLFTERAAAACADFVLSRGSAPCVSRICRQLDGIPLAIELAAARTKFLSLEEIETRLHHFFQILTAGSRTALPRRQTLEAAMEWSYRLLETQERSLLTRLSLFAAPFGIEAVCTVCGDQDAPEASTEQLLGSLVDKSLVTQVSREGGSRYRCWRPHAGMPGICCEKSGEESAMQQRHAEYFLSLVEWVQEEWERYPAAASELY